RLRLAEHPDDLLFTEPLLLHDFSCNSRYLYREILTSSMALLSGDKPDVVDLQIHLDWGASLRREEPYGVISNFSGQVMIYDFRRFAYTDPVYIERGYLRYELDFSEPLDGRISLGAKDFTIVGRQELVRSEHLTLDPDQRPPLMRGG
ncbi:MAG TPA: hypothetical protein VLI39_20780, partial [Sedimentisphaerales bacterium]|nr:hypothetical protein [Sedimentisphaerales bacterium]